MGGFGGASRRREITTRAALRTPARVAALQPWFAWNDAAERIGRLLRVAPGARPG